MGVAAHHPLFAVGMGVDAERLRSVLARMLGRDVSPTEDVTALATETLERTLDRLNALERAVSAKVETGA